MEQRYYTREDGERARRGPTAWDCLRGMLKVLGPYFREGQIGFDVVIND